MEKANGPCGSHAYCLENSQGATSCVCDAGFENWAGYNQGGFEIIRKVKQLQALYKFYRVWL